MRSSSRAGCLPSALILSSVLELAQRPDPTVLVSTWLLALETFAFSTEIGRVVAKVTNSAGEAIPFGTVILAPLLFLLGLFTGVSAEGPRCWVARVLPFGYLTNGFQLVPRRKPTLRKHGQLPAGGSRLPDPLSCQVHGSGPASAGERSVSDHIGVPTEHAPDFPVRSGQRGRTAARLTPAFPAMPACLPQSYEWLSAAT
ncbi:MAG: hypothetical protein ACYDD0_03520 [Candidatus Dormibacteria bacterium]